jgi:SAM-dependent methyltransferase
VSGTVAVSRSGYDPTHFAAIAAAERRHFWFRARNRVLRTVLTPLGAAMPAPGRVLEIGCGTGNTLRVLEQACPAATVIGMDLFVEGLRFARAETRARLLQARIEAPPFRTRFHLIGLFDVLEHIEGDRAALEAIHAMLEPGGHLALTVPAGQHLWSPFDEAAHHCRRYEMPNLLALLKATGYEVQLATPFMTATYPALWLSRRLARRAQKGAAGGQAGDDAVDAELHVPGWMNLLLDASLRPEGWVLKAGGRLPVGTSLLAVAARR